MLPHNGEKPEDLSDEVVDQKAHNPTARLERMGIEKTTPLYDRVVIGHSYRDFDRDQFFTYFQARFLGVVSSATPVEFKANVAEEDLKDTRVAVIEGGAKDKNIPFNTFKSGNFDNDPKSDDPAVFKFYEAASNQVIPEAKKKGLVTSDDVDKLNGLANWMRAVDKGKKPESIKVFTHDDLEVADNLFQELKHQYTGRDPQEMLDAAYSMMAALFSDDRINKGIKMAEIPEYAVLLEEGKHRTKSDKLRVFEQLREPGNFNAITTIAGYNLVYADIRGLGVDRGGLNIAIQKAKDEQSLQTDLVVLVDDEFDDNGVIIGNRIIVAVPGTKVLTDESNQDSEVSSKLAGKDIRKLLSENLNEFEQLFGGGVQVIDNAKYDGHPGLIGSPRKGEASHLEPKELWSAVQKYFDAPRYTQEEFEIKVREVAKKIGVETFTWNRKTLVSEASLPSREMTLTIPAEDRRNIVRLSEEDIAVYEEVLNEDTEHNKEILLSKTEVSEHPEIVRVREARAVQYLEQCIENGNGERALVALNDLNHSSVESLDPNLVLQLLHVISADSTAIDQIWNKNNLQYRISDKYLPDWIRDSLDQYKAARYIYSSALPAKVNNLLVGKAITEAAESGDKKLQARTAYDMMRILTSKEYKESHTQENGNIVDKHLQNILKMISHEKIDSEVKQVLVETLVGNYGTGQMHHWRRIALADPALLLNVTGQFPKEFEPIIDNIDLSLNVKPIEGIDESQDIEPTPEKILRTQIRQAEAGLKDAYFNLVVQIGRPILEDIKVKGIHRLGSEGIKELGVEPDALLVVPGLLNMDNEHQEHKKVVAAAVNRILDLAELIPEDGKIRFVAGSFFGPLTSYMTGTLTRLFAHPKYAHLKDRFVQCNFNMQQDFYYDTKLESEDIDSIIAAREKRNS